MAAGRGYDAPLDDPKDDAFERRRVAEHVATLACTTPEEWSVRIAIYGRWGEGKTTVARFAERSIRDSGHITFWFSPWSIQSGDDLWLQFTLDLDEALSRHGIQLADTSIAKWRARLLRAKPYLDILKDTSSFSRITLGGGIALLQNVLNVGGDAISSIRDQLKGRRVVVFIDDIDRMDPKLVPGMLLALREVLDLPRFSFVLLLDHDIVSQALSGYHTAWTRGDHFLDKIVDFPVHLPSITAEQSQRFFRAEGARYCPFALGSHVDAIGHLLPQNPRRLRQFVRHLATLQTEVDRHAADELDWLIVSCMVLLRLESQRFAAVFVDSALGSDGFLTEHVFQRRWNEDNDSLDGMIDEIFSKANVTSADQKEQITNIVWIIVRHTSFSNISMLKYYSDFAVRPHALTWKEFNELFAVWRERKRLQDVNQWIICHANSRKIPVESIGRELLDTLYNYRERELHAAAEALVDDEHTRRVKNGVSAYIVMVMLYLRGLDCLPSGYLTDVNSYNRLCSTVADWIHFVKNDADRDSRKQEISWLRRATREKPDLAVEAAGTILAVTARTLNAAPRLQLRNELLAEVLPQVAGKAVELFRRPGGIAQINQWTEPSIYHFVLLNRNRLVWQSPHIGELMRTLEDAATNSVVHLNVIEFLHLLEAGPQRGSRFHDVDVESVLEDYAIMAELWQAAMARRVQYRSRSGIRELRDKLIQRGAAEGALPLPKWLSVEED